MPGQPVEIPHSMSAWCAGLYDYGLLYNTDTSWQRSLQCHITVTNDNAYVGIGFHISLYEPLGALIGAGSYRPNTAFAKLYFYPDGGEMKIDFTRGNRRNVIRYMPGFQTVRQTGIDFFYGIYPEYRPVVTYTFAEEDFPALGR